ncbi:hypothetical protein CEXT_592871, partial [Caerostris extrusa]
MIGAWRSPEKNTRSQGLARFNPGREAALHRHALGSVRQRKCPTRRFAGFYFTTVRSFWRPLCRG